MSNARIGAIGFVTGFFLAVMLNFTDNMEAMLSLARMVGFGMLFAAMAVALFGDRQRRPLEEEEDEAA